MSDYISREAILAKCAYEQPWGADAVIAMIEDFPAADVRENKRGKWIEIPDEVFASTYKCSSCGEAPLCDEYSDYTFSPYCPNCGADMREEQT